MWRRRNLVCCWWECKLVQPLWKTAVEFPQEIKNRITIWPSNSTPGYISKKMKALTQKDTCIPMFIAAIFRIAKTWKQSKCPSSDDWLENGFLIEQPLESCPDTPLSEHCWLVKHTAEPQGWAPWYAPCMTYLLFPLHRAPRHLRPTTQPHHS